MHIPSPITCPALLGHQRWAGNQVCIPLELYDRTLADLNDSCQGTEKMQFLTRAAVCWPGTTYAKRCRVCMKHKMTQPVKLLLPRDFPNSPWQDITTNCFTHQGKVLFKIPNSIQQMLKELLSQYVPLKYIFTDNRPPFLLKILPNLC